MNTMGFDSRDAAEARSTLASERPTLPDVVAPSACTHPVRRPDQDEEDYLIECDQRELDFRREKMRHSLKMEQFHRETAQWEEQVAALARELRKSRPDVGGGRPESRRSFGPRGRGGRPHKAPRAQREHHNASVLKSKVGRASTGATSSSLQFEKPQVREEGRRPATAKDVPWMRTLEQAAFHLSHWEEGKGTLHEMLSSSSDAPQGTDSPSFAMPPILEYLDSLLDPRAPQLLT